VKGAGAMPEGPRWQSLQLLNRIMDSMYRTVFMPPTATPAAAQEMRGAFEKLAADPEFVAACERVVKTKVADHPRADRTLSRKGGWAISLKQRCCSSPAWTRQNCRSAPSRRAQGLRQIRLD
jgi:hypothetical protein